MKDSRIEWTDHTFNPWRGCTKVSAGCANCYAETLSGRNPKVLGTWGPSGTRVVAAESAWREPLKWDRAAAAAGERHRVFCASLADVFEDWQGPMVGADGKQLYQPRELGIPYGESFPRDPMTMADVRRRLFDMIDATPNLDWLLLTKRPESVLKMTHDAWCKPVPGHVRQNEGDGYHWQWPGNVWLGTSVEDQATADARIPHLLKVPASVRFLSCEPLLGPVNLEANRMGVGPWHDDPWMGGVGWVIIGGESGPGARPMHPAWARSIRDQCRAADVPFFFKQWGEYGDPAILHNDQCAGNVFPDGTLVRRLGKKAAGRLLDGTEHSEFPTPEVAR